MKFWTALFISPVIPLQPHCARHCKMRTLQYMPLGSLVLQLSRAKSSGTNVCLLLLLLRWEKNYQDNTCLKIWSFLKAERKRCRMCFTIPSGRACPIVAMDNALHCVFCLQKKKLLCFPALMSLECELALHNAGCKQSICECKIASAFQK